MQFIRLATLFHDEEVFSFGEVWNLLYRESSPPNFYTPHGPVIRGFYLIERSTAREEDRIADLVLITSISYFLLCGVAGLKGAKACWKNGSAMGNIWIRETML